MSQAITRPSPATHDDGELTITTGGMTLGGWQDIRVTRGVERMPGDFNLALTERNPDASGSVVVEPFQPCVVRIGGDAVITGYVNDYEPEISPEGHNVRVVGAGKCQDLVDCSAVVPSMQMTTSSAVSLAQQLAKPFGITASSPLGTVLVDDYGKPAQFNVNLGETPFEIIDRVARFAKVLAFEGADGNLVLDQVGRQQMSSGFVQGVNIESARCRFSASERFSEYVACIMSAQQFSQVDGADGNTLGRVFDKAVPRYRPRVIISEQATKAGFLALQRATWEMNRRIGRSQILTLTCDSWRDSAGKLWEPNFLASVHIPALKLFNQMWVIGEVTYRRGADGTHADLILMPPAAYSPEPQSLQLYLWQVGQSLGHGAAAASSTNAQALAAAQSPGTTVNLTPPS